MQKPPQFSKSDSVFNSPREMLARFLYVVSLTVLAFGVLLAAAGLVARRADELAVAAIALLAGWGIQGWLKRNGQLAAVRTGFNEMLHSPSFPEHPRLAQMTKLLRELKEMEAKRGSREFDPWALQTLRREIGALVGDDPVLREYFKI